METNDALKKVFMNKAEACIDRLLKDLQEGEEGDFQGTEQAIQAESREFGRSCLEALLEGKAEQQGSVARREGSCGHQQRLVSTRPRQILTLLGPIVVHRAYYQCLRKKEESKEIGSSCSHGEAPFDQQWGWDTQRSSPGVQKVVSYLSAQMTQEEVAEAVSRLLPFPLSARQARHVAQPVGEAFLRRENEQVQEMFKQGATKHTSKAERQNARAEPIKRLSVKNERFERFFQELEPRGRTLYSRVWFSSHTFWSLWQHNGDRSSVHSPHSILFFMGPA